MVHLNISFQISWRFIVSFQDPVCVVDDSRGRVPIVGRICIWVIAKPSQHGGNLGHIPHHISRDVASPLGECFQVHGFDDLVHGSLNLGQGDAPRLANEVLMVQDCVTPGDAQEV